MLRLPRLQYLRPRSVAEAADLAASTPGAMFIAGGTDLVPNLKRRQFDVSTLISLNALTDTGRIEGNAEKGVTIGAGATLDQIANHPQLQGSYRFRKHRDQHWQARVERRSPPCLQGIHQETHRDRR